MYWGLTRLGFTSDIDFVLQDDGEGAYIREWYSDKPQPSAEEIQNAEDAYHAEYASLEYARKRKAEYDQMGNQFEMQFDDKRDGTTTWVDKINEIKAKYPKG